MFHSYCLNATDQRWASRVISANSSFIAELYHPVRHLKEHHFHIPVSDNGQSVVAPWCEPIVKSSLSIK